MTAGERILVPTFRIPTLIHTRSSNSQWLNEISHRHPLWLHPSDAEQLGSTRTGSSYHDADGPLRHPVVANRGDPPWGSGGQSPHGSVAPRGGRCRSWGAGKASIERDDEDVGGCGEITVRSRTKVMNPIPVLSGGPTPVYTRI
ncbi:MAG: hypothetical protein Ct9H300mP12_04490 [Acidimicrobiales bacterium]|nr:MAG: hypothetical protein Ct9H300mP12_04490 [Acidimicrobiales bacterium]